MSRIQRRSFLSSSAALLGGSLIASENGQAQTAANKVQHHGRTASAMAETANHWVAALSPEQKAKAAFSFGDEERMRWFVTPGPDRNGLALSAMAPYQKHLASALLVSGLSQAGYVTAVNIMSQQGDNAETYYFSIFGTPSDTGTWGYRVEGHHLSQNYTVTNGRVVDGPSFFGALPAEIKEGPRQGMRVLPQEEDLGFELIRGLDEPQQKVAIVNPVAYGDILTGETRMAALKGQPSGLAASKMNGRQFDALRALTELYARNLPEEIAQWRLDQIEKTGREGWFAWAGGVNPGTAHYYRVQTASFLIEFDNLDKSGNHIHSIWRDFANDWGVDLLKAHYEESHEREKV